MCRYRSVGFLCCAENVVIRERCHACGQGRHGPVKERADDPSAAVAWANDPQRLEESAARTAIHQSVDRGAPGLHDLPADLLNRYQLYELLGLLQPEVVRRTELHAVVLRPDRRDV